MRGAAGLGAALVEAEGRVPVRHQTRVRHDPRHPAVEPEDDVEDAAGVAPGEEERDAREQDEEADEPAAEAAPLPVVRPRGGERPPADHDPDEQVLGDREQPPLDEHEAARELPRVLDVQRRRVVRRVVERERRIPVGAERAVRVERDPPRPAEHPDVEVEDPARIPPGEEDREERDHRQYEEREPQEGQHDVVRDREQPLDEPEPPAQVGVEPALDPDRRRRRRFGALPGGHGRNSYTPCRARDGARSPRLRANR